MSDKQNTGLSDTELNEISGGVVIDPGQRLIQYRVVHGDTLGKIAKKYGTTVEAIMALNKIIKNKNLILTGWVLTVPDNR